jgi:branched-chain amino acid transport system ATP-binding protein
VRYGSVEALRGVDLELLPGQALAVLGANGAGKSTLVKTMMGLVRLTAGEVRGPDGERLDRLPPYEVAKRGIAMVPEGSGVFTRLTVEENLSLGLVARRLTAAEVTERLDEVFAHFPILGERRRLKASTLSGGERQMLGLGRALAIRPRALLLDEPSLGLAPLMIERVFAEIERLISTGIGIVLVEQNARQALRVSEHGIVLERGRISVTGSAAELANDPRVVEAYLGGTDESQRA